MRSIREVCRKCCLQVCRECWNLCRSFGNATSAQNTTSSVTLRRAGTAKTKTVFPASRRKQFGVQTLSETWVNFQVKLGSELFAQSENQQSFCQKTAAEVWLARRDLGGSQIKPLDCGNSGTGSDVFRCTFVPLPGSSASTCGSKTAQKDGLSAGGKHPQRSCSRLHLL